MIHKITFSVEYNKKLKNLDTLFNEPINQNSIKVPKVVKLSNLKKLLKNFGDWCNKQPNVLPANKAFVTITKSFASYNNFYIV